MAAQGVEPHRLGVGEALLKKVSARRATLFFGIPVLIEGPEHVERLAVQEKLAVSGLESPKANDPLDRIDGRVADDEFDDKIVEVRRFRRPGVSPGKGKYRVKAAQSKMVYRLRDEFAPARKRDLQSRRGDGAR